MSSKPENPTYHWVELKDTPFIGHAFMHNDDFLLSDNFREYVREWDSRLQATQYHEPFPIRINYTGIFFCVEGTLDMQINIVTHHLEKGDLMICSPGDLCMFEGASEDLQFIMIGLGNPVYFDSAGKEMTVELRKRIIQHPVFHLSGKDTDTFRTLYILLGRKLTEEGFPYKEDLIRAYMSTMSVYARQWIQDLARESASITRQEDLFNRFLEEVDLHFREEHELAFYADRLCITPKYMSQIIYQVSGHFANEWIKEYLIQEAKALLKSNKYTVLQVSEILNFPNPSFFGQYFKKAVGVTPRQYQNS